MATRDSSGALMVIKSPTLNGNAITGIAFTAWAASTTYEEGDQVSVSGGNARCITQHDSVAGGLTYSAGALGGTQSANWLAVPAGNVAQLSDRLTYTTGGETQTFRKANLSGTSTFSAVRADTIQATVYEDADDLAQKGLVQDARMTLDIYTQGRPTGGSDDKRPKATASVVVTSISGGLTFGSPTERTIDFAVQGQITFTEEVGS